MASGFILWPILLVSISVSAVEPIPLYNLFTNAVIRAQYLHQLAADIYKEFERSLPPDAHRQLSKISPLAGCYSDSIPTPTGKDETQEKSDGYLLRISSALIQSWVYPLKTLSKAFSNSLMFGTSDGIFEKLEDLSEGINELMREAAVKMAVLLTHQESPLIMGTFSVMNSNNILPLEGDKVVGDGGVHMDELRRLTYENFDVILRNDAALMKNYGLLACFKKDMHKVETYLKVTKCRRFVESNCTL